MEGIKENLKEQLSEIEQEFNQILFDRGFDSIVVKNFRVRLRKNEECSKWEWICDRNGRCYKRCVEI